MSGFLPSLETFAKVCITNLCPICLLIMNIGYTCHCGNLVDSRSDSFSLNFTYDCLMAITHRRRSYLLRPKLPDIPVCFSSWLSNWWVSLAIGCYSGANLFGIRGCCALRLRAAISRPRTHDVRRNHPQVVSSTSKEGHWLQWGGY